MSSGLRILFLTHSFNSLAQRLHVELTERGHEVSIEFDINDAVAMEAVALCEPDLIIAPYLRRRIPDVIWQNHVCLVVHPGIKGDRGPSALDWAIQNRETEWGVTVLQANGVMDGGDIWAARTFSLGGAAKSSVYRNAVTEAAVDAVLEALEKFRHGGFKPEPLDYTKPDVRGRPHRFMNQHDRRIDWQRDNTATVLAKMRAADAYPGVLDDIAGTQVYLFHGVEEKRLRADTPGEIIQNGNLRFC